MGPSDMSPEEFAHAAAGPNRFAFDWVEAVSEARVDDVWPLMTAGFRLAMAQSWIVNNPAVMKHPSTVGLDRAEVARRLASASPRHDLFEHLARVSLREIRGTWNDADMDDLLIGTRPRVLSATLELVRLFYRPDMSQDAEGNYYFAPDTYVRGASILVELIGGGWQVAGAGDALLEPGWPPTLRRVVNPED